MNRRIFAVSLALGTLAACNLWGSKVPSGFEGWFHLQNGQRAENLTFATSGLLQIHDLGCDQSVISDQEWASDGDALVAVQTAGAPHFTQDPSTPGALQVSPGMFGPGPEQWLPGALCLVCPPGDAGVVACTVPQVIDAGTQ
jgi:hypothetical protein